MRVRSLTVLLALLLAAAGARAAAPARFSFDYSGPSECPAADELVSRIHARMPDADEVPSGSPHAAVRVMRTDTGFDGELSWDGDVGSTRHFEAAGCDEVVDALALAIVVALSGERAPPPPTDTTVAPSTDRTSAPPPRGPPAPAPPATPVPVPRAATSRPATAGAPHWRGAVAADLGITGDIGPRLAPTGSLAFELRMGGTRFLSPSLRASVGYARSTAGDPTFAGFHRIAAGLEICPLRLATESPALSLEPCVGALSGVHTGELASGGSASAFWFSLDVLARARWEPSRRWFLELWGGVEMPTVLNRFWVERARQNDRRLVFDTQQVAEIAGFGGGVTFF